MMKKQHFERTCLSQLVTAVWCKKIWTPYFALAFVMIMAVSIHVFIGSLANIPELKIHMLKVGDHRNSVAFHSVNKSTKDFNSIAYKVNKGHNSVVIKGKYQRTQIMNFRPKLKRVIRNKIKTRRIKGKTVEDFCKPKGLVGRLLVRKNKTITREFEKRHADIGPGGHWAPSNCVARNKVAIIIPYRDRRNHLHTLLYHLIPVLKRQQSEFQIFVVEQAGNQTFNKGMIMNAGFKEAVRISGFPCYLFHDVDLIPEDDRNMYACSASPCHLSVAVDKFRYILPYVRLVGGVFAIRREDFEKVNGYSNLYWGWGAEDDDMAKRIEVTGMNLTRPPVTVARYKMLKHKGRIRVPRKWSSYLLKTVKKRFSKDGLNSLDYNVTFIHKDPLFTHVMVDVGEPPNTVKNISAIIR